MAERVVHSDAYNVVQNYLGLSLTLTGNENQQSTMFSEPNPNSKTLGTIEGTRIIKVEGTAKYTDGNVEYLYGKILIPKSVDISTQFYVYVVLGRKNISAGTIIGLNFEIYKEANTDGSLNKLDNIDCDFETDTSGKGQINSQFIYDNGTINTGALLNTDNYNTSKKLKTYSTEEAASISVEELTGPYVPDMSDWVKADDLDVSDYNNILDLMDIDRLRGIFGMPYQFLPTTDPRIDGSENNEVFGTTYGDKIASRLPLLYITPGNPAFLGSYKAGDNLSLGQKFEDMIQSFTGFLSGGDTNSLSSLLDGYQGKLYSIEPAYSEYFKYVNPMCRIGAVYLGLENEKIDGKPCTTYNWAFNDNGDYSGNYAEGTSNTGFESLTSNIRDFQKFIYYKAAIPFYINSEYQFSDSLGNETTESALSSTINGFSDKARELQFLLGTTTSQIAADFDTLGSSLNGVKNNLEDFTQKLTSGGGLFSSLTQKATTVAAGGRIQFPNIWSNSSFNKSYNINIKLNTPDLDKKSWWLNIYVPLCHILALAMPRGEFQHSYSAPFIVKAFYKGMFNIDMGIITDMTIQKGKEGGWTKDGLPTTVDVQFTIQDLYSSLSMTPSGLAYRANVLQNIAEMDYLANLCGININVPDTLRMVELYATLNLRGKFIDIPANIVTGLENKISNRINSLFSTF